MRLDGALPGLTAQPNASRSSSKAAPRLRNIVLLGKTAPRLPDREAVRRRCRRQVPEDAVHRSRLGVRVRDVGMMLYTSGTTANPKGCLITHEAMVRNSISLGRYRYAADRTRTVLVAAADVPHRRHPADVAIFDVGGAYAHHGATSTPARRSRCSSARRSTATYPCSSRSWPDLIYHPNFTKTDLSRVTLMNSNFAVQPPGIKDAMLKAMPNAI